MTTIEVWILLGLVLFHIPHQAKNIKLKQGAINGRTMEVAAVMMITAGKLPASEVDTTNRQTLK